MFKLINRIGMKAVLMLLADASDRLSKECITAQSVLADEAMVKGKDKSIQDLAKLIGEVKVLTDIVGICDGFAPVVSKSYNHKAKEYKTLGREEIAAKV